ncbi:hypothetical protein BDV23DRAFT_49496 [Aspergillus alliaceus]|uniref:Uncharacterized protein n=1 Tax=Petromyces alliaceus TaxID=209559 RepID=A0A5N7BQA7_PETAA|nr:hypothetical protein BDV23DRAFT_49496 [Aspergillus alliaceus]
MVNLRIHHTFPTRLSHLSTKSLPKTDYRYNISYRSDSLLTSTIVQPIYTLQIRSILCVLRFCVMVGCNCRRLLEPQHKGTSH